MHGVIVIALRGIQFAVVKYIMRAMVNNLKFKFQTFHTVLLSTCPDPRLPERSSSLLPPSSQLPLAPRLPSPPPP